MLLFCLDSAQDKPSEALLKAARIGDLQTVSIYGSYFSCVSFLQYFKILQGFLCTTREGLDVSS